MVFERVDELRGDGMLSRFLSWGVGRSALIEGDSLVRLFGRREGYDLVYMFQHCGLSS